MGLDARFHEAVAPLLAPGMGTEQMGPLLYSLVRFTRPRSVLEVGLGYTSPYLAQALKDNIAEIAEDKTVLGEPDGDPRKSLLSAEYYASPYAPTLHAIDDFSVESSSAGRVLEVLKTLGLDSLVASHEGDFRGFSRKMPRSSFPLDFVWFDCGGPPEYVDFLNEYWPLINQDHGLLLLHYTYWNLTVNFEGVDHTKAICGSIANEIKRQQMAAGFDARFEVLSLMEPHKTRQGSVTMVRKLAGTSMCRNFDFREEMTEIHGVAPTPIAKL